MAKRNLTGKQRAFIEAYLRCWNATEAARMAGYSAESENYLAVTGHRLIRNDKVWQEISARLPEFHMGADTVLARLADQAETSTDDFVTVTPDGNYKLDLAKAKERGKLHSIKSIKETKYGLAIELYDSQAALVHLGRHHKLFTDNITVRTWRDDVIDLIKAGKISIERLGADLGNNDLAARLFKEAGIDVNASS